MGHERSTYRRKGRVVAEESWGRVADDGTVFVRTKDGERAVGQWPDANPEEALAFYTRRYDALAFEVDLLEKRVQAGTVSPDDARAAVKKVTVSIDEAQAVGDLDGLRARLEALTPLVAQQREKKKAERAAKVEEAREAKTKIATEAETIAAGTDWRHGVTRLRELLDEWKALPRLDKSSDDELWHRFSSARTTYTRHRKQHFSELSSKRDEAAVVKERLAAEAEGLASSTDWGPTSGRFRDLMRQWKAAGPAPREVDDKLWARFRSAQDAFFGARDAIQAEESEEQVANLAAKEALLVEIEAILPVTDAKAARDQLRDLLDRWDAIGKVPRDSMRPIDSRLRAVEQAVKAAEDEVWNRSNPEARARAEATVKQLQALIGDLEKQAAKAESQGNTRKATEAREAIEARQAWLTQAQNALADFS
jgi:soluble cytochrome b562